MGPGSGAIPERLILLHAGRCGEAEGFIQRRQGLARAPQTVLSGILDALGIDAGSACEIPVRTSKLADKTSRDWRRRFQTGSA